MESSGHVLPHALHSRRRASIVLRPHARHQHKSHSRARHGTLEGADGPEQSREPVGQPPARDGGEVGHDCRIAQDRLELLLCISAAAVLGDEPRFEYGEEEVGRDAAHDAAHDESGEEGVLLEEVDEDFEDAIEDGGLFAPDLIDEGTYEGRRKCPGNEPEAVQGGDGISVTLIENIEVCALEAVGEHDGNMNYEVGDPKGRERQRALGLLNFLALRFLSHDLPVFRGEGG
mmetsp:Transcript_44714/g.136416  ORF Transcript_44714/g.136416 Transcript_44714/m.136416 type:complete len:231 (+) Transcript_44714:1299-1991(+)